MSARVIEKIEEFQHRKIGVVVELSALGTAIEHCLRVACAVQSKFKNGLHQVLDTSIPARLIMVRHVRASALGLDLMRTPWTTFSGLKR
jgi:hypothetical protein